jgi:1,4-dihydroxy-2-naphthoate octaprenyltransferase
LNKIEHVDPSGWASKVIGNRWLIAVRAPVLVLTLSSALVGGALAFGHEQADWIACTIMLTGLLFAHATNNLLNDFTDFRRGVDDAGYFRVQYGTHILAQELVSQREFMIYLGVSGSVAAICCAYLVILRGEVLWLPALIGAVCLLFYTWPMKQWALGEVAVWLTWGPTMVGGAYAATTGEWSWPAAWIGALFGLGPTAVILAKHVDKRAADLTKGVRTLPVVLGPSGSRRLTQAVIAAHFLATIALVAGGMSPWLLVTFLAAPQAYRAMQSLQSDAPSKRPADYPEEIWPLWFVAFTFGYARTVGVLFIVAIVIDRVSAQL